ncbi:hypothetical protein GCM10009555_051340 [Acrocarpospora macrocephala]|uniref:Putative zinc-finger domain-containing protein n=1 Tax=Acrocarpospora macrocephala TaxID=150177 RepID=A0A5M3XF57_9ACTN|nr:zf-HC2 domain-containing protein [Acrocarpospora macrocephala]GES16698.1 hypothetical protein Amac_102960 [Acrocarpospora macrocephala]
MLSDEIPESSHHDVAAYALGVLDPEDIQGFELHLVSCERCRIELNEFGELPGLLNEVKSASQRVRP